MINQRVDSLTSRSLSSGLPVHVAASPTVPFSTPKTFGARNDNRQGQETPNDGEAPNPSFARVALTFCVLPSSMSSEINQEDRDGHEEFTRGQRPDQLSHNRNLAAIFVFL